MDYTKDIGDQLLLIRPTGAIPSNGEVITTADARVSSEGGSYDSFPLELGVVNTINPFMSRHTIYFACNSLVNGGLDWDNNKYFILDHLSIIKMQV